MRELIILIPPRANLCTGRQIPKCVWNCQFSALFPVAVALALAVLCVADVPFLIRAFPHFQNFGDGQGHRRRPGREMHVEAIPSPSTPPD